MNPIYAERIGGLARIVKVNSIAALDNIPLWHERDLTNSSCERIIIPEACILTDYILQLGNNLVENLFFNQQNIKRNLGMTQGRVMAESIMIRMSEKGCPRQIAHEIVRESALSSYKEKSEFADKLKADKKVLKYLTNKEIDDALDPAKYVGTAQKQVEAALKKLS
jgi:adenylosuccinate lyase